MTNEITRMAKYAIEKGITKKIKEIKTNPRDFADLAEIIMLFDPDNTIVEEHIPSSKIIEAAVRYYEIAKIVWKEYPKYIRKKK